MCSQMGPQNKEVAKTIMGLGLGLKEKQLKFSGVLRDVEMA